MLYRKTAQAKKISERSEWKIENSLLIASAEQSKLAFEAAQKELKILEIFIQDAKNEIAVLTAEKAQEITEASQRAAEAEARVKVQDTLEASEAELEDVKNKKEAVLQENEALKKVGAVSTNF